MPEEARDAFFQLVHYPVMGSATVAKIYNCATLGSSIGLSGLWNMTGSLLIIIIMNLPVVNGEA